MSSPGRPRLDAIKHFPVVEFADFERRLADAGVPAARATGVSWQLTSRHHRVGRLGYRGERWRGAPARLGARPTQLQGARDCRCPRQTTLAAQMQKSADKAVVAVSVIITAACPVAVVGEMLEHQVSSCTPCAIWPSGIGLSAPDPGNEPILARAAVHPAEKRSR